MGFYDLSDCDITGNHDISMFADLGGTFSLDGNSNLTGITHTGSTSNFGSYNVSSCNLTGNHDVSMLLGLGGDFNVSSNPNLTSITHAGSTSNFEKYRINSTGIANLDLSMITVGGGTFGTFSANNCPNLTAITHSASTESIKSYNVYSCDLIGNHDISMLSNMSGSLSFNSNLNLTSVTHPAISELNTYNGYSCDMIGTQDMTMIDELGSFNMYANSNLTRILHAPSSNPGDYTAWGCDLQPAHNMSMLSGRTDYIRVHDNPNLTSIALGPSSGTFRNTNTSSATKAISMNDCDLGFVDFMPLSSATMNTGATHRASITLQNNGMNEVEVNRTLVSFDEMSTLNPSGWSGVILDISGSNQPPNGSSGGYNGTGATISLISKGWTVTTS